MLEDTATTGAEVLDDAAFGWRRLRTLGPERAGDRTFVDNHCANCLRPLPPSDPGLFCSKWCSETASDVRYFRRALREGRLEVPDVVEAIRTRVAFLLAGGYSSLERTLNPQQRDGVKQRDDGMCVKCGAPGTEIDHISGSSPDPSNLQLLCSNCHRTKTHESFIPVDSGGQAVIDRFFAERVDPDVPRLLADDETRWNSVWRALKSARRGRLTPST